MNARHPWGHVSRKIPFLLYVEVVDGLRMSATNAAGMGAMCSGCHWNALYRSSLRTYNVASIRLLDMVVKCKVQVLLLLSTSL